MTKKQIKNLVIILILILWAIWLGQRMKSEEQAVKENDRKADEYFEKQDSLNKIKSNQ
ncbi:MAG TPA: hypothetical protein VJY62_04900 [Bacteroidia bacterium]|nr:hypothetical protein [Bacteroidia bacterium]